MNPTQKQVVDSPEPTGYALTEAGLQALADVRAEDFHPSAHDVDRPGGIDVPDILLSAALYLERHGWIQGGYYDGTTGVFTPPACMVGAIGMVCYGGPADAPAQHFDDPGFADFEAAVLHLDRYLLVEDGSESYEFNDARGRTLDQVTGVLRQAAVRPAHELIDALKAIDDMNDRLAKSGVTHEQVLHLLSGGSLREFQTDPTACLWCDAPGGYPYCTAAYDGVADCADKAACAAEGGDAR